MDIKLKINQHVIVDGINCEIIDIVEEDEKVYYECLPIEFNSISRFVQSDKIKVE